MRWSGLFCMVTAWLLLVAGIAICQTGPNGGNEKRSSEPSPSESPPPKDPDAGSASADGRPRETAPSPTAATPGQTASSDLAANLTIFILAIFVGFEVITKVPPTLHTPLMSGSNAISGITIVGALVIAGAGLYQPKPLVGLLAVILATINVVGGFLVTHRMLLMFKKR